MTSRPASVRKDQLQDFKTEKQLAEQILDSVTQRQEDQIDLSDDEDRCLWHEGEVLVAQDSQDPAVYGCQTCVYEGKIAQPHFLSFSAKATKLKIEKSFATLDDKMNEIKHLEPQELLSRIQNDITAYFNKMRNHIDEIERDVV